MEETANINIALVCTALSAGVLGYLLFNAISKRNRKSRPVAEISGNRGLSLLHRLQPLLSDVVDVVDRIGFLRRPMETFAGRLRMRLVRAGQPGGLTPKEFVAFKVLLGSLFLLVSTAQFGLPHLPICLAAAFFVFYWPTAWLAEKTKRRNVQILGELPDALDLLALMMNAGLDLGQSIQRYLQDAARTPLNVLLEEVRAQMILGRTRSDALEYFARKVDLPAITGAVSSFVQADRLGSSIGQTLAQQAADLREQRLQRAEASGQTAPIKLMAPLLLFIVPCVALILFGPMLIQFLTGK
jgi:tight adherence protein C